MGTKPGLNGQRDVTVRREGLSDRDEVFDVVVVGAGIAGLAAAATAADAGVSVALVDGRRPGGRAVSDQVGRFTFNRGAHALYRHSVGRSVLKRLGVRVSGTLPTYKGAQGVLRDRTGLVPVGPRSFVRSPLLDRRSKRLVARALVGMPGWRTERLADRTAAEWMDDLIGTDGDARAMFELGARTATYVADFEAVSADVVATQVRAGALGVDYLHGGWASLVDGLETAARRRGVQFSVGTSARQVVPDGRGVRVELGERSVVGRRVVLAVGTPWASGSLLPAMPAAWSALGPAARVACLDLGLAEIPSVAVSLFGVDRPLYLVRHGPPATGLAPDGGAVVHAMKYLRPDEDPPPGQARAELEAHCRLAGIEPDDAEKVRYLHRMVACAALPGVGTGGMRGRPGVSDTGYDGVLVAGDWVGPVGHLVDASLASGETAGRLAVQQLEHEPLVAVAA